MFALAYSKLERAKVSKITYDPVCSVARTKQPVLVGSGIYLYEVNG